MDIRRYRDGKLQVRGNARRPFRHVRRIQKLANSATVHYSLLPIHYSDDTATAYYNYRHYEPVMGRWLSRDPTIYEKELALYVFCLNSGECGFDRLGLYRDDLGYFTGGVDGGKMAEARKNGAWDVALSTHGKNRWDSHEPKCLSGWDLEYERGLFGDITVFTTDPVFVELWTEANKIYTYKAKDTLTVSVSAGKSVSAGGALDIVKGKYYTIFGTLHVGILIEDRYRKWRCACKSRMPVGAAVRGGWLSVKRTTDWSREYLDPSITVVGKWDDEVEVFEGIETIGIGGGGVSVGVGGASGSVTYNTD